MVNVVLKEGGFAPFLNADVGQYSTNATDRYINDGTTADVNGGFGVGLGRVGPVGVKEPITFAFWPRPKSTLSSEWLP